MDNTHDNNCATWRYPNWPCSCKPNTATATSSDQGPSLVSPQAVVTALSILALIFIIPGGFIVLAFFAVIFIGVVIYGLIVMYKEGDLTDNNNQDS